MWTSKAKCRGQDILVFFPLTDASAGPALRICAQCEVREPCLDYALRHNELGVWGATTEKQRENVKRTRARRRKQALAREVTAFERDLDELAQEANAS